MNPLDCCFPKPELNVDTDTRVSRSCNCCNNNNCCLPFFRRRRHASDCDQRIIEAYNRGVAEQLKKKEGTNTSK